MRIVLLLHPSRLSEGLALVEDAQRDLREHCFIPDFGGPAYLSFGQVFQHQ
ncbi:MAG: hypothetical protein ACYDAL_02150 [Candidatus Dormibacteraceae bacterium]